MALTDVLARGLGITSGSKSCFHDDAPLCSTSYPVRHRVVRSRTTVRCAVETTQVIISHSQSLTMQCSLSYRCHLQLSWLWLSYSIHPNSPQGWLTFKVLHMNVYAWWTKHSAVKCAFSEVLQVREGWREKSRAVQIGSAYPAKEFCSNCGLCDTYYVAHVKDSCAFLGNGESRAEAYKVLCHRTAPRGANMVRTPRLFYRMSPQISVQGNVCNDPHKRCVLWF